MRVPAPLRSPVTEPVAGELRRVQDRWRVLSLDDAQERCALVRELVQALADHVAEAQGVALSVVPDLGPGTLIDQLTVMVHEAAELSAEQNALAARLTRLRRSLG